MEIRLFSFAGLEARRARTNGRLALLDPTTFYSGGARGYTKANALKI